MRTILVIGASSVLGRAAAQALSDEGARLVLTYCRVDRGIELQAIFPNAQTIRLDVRNLDNILSIANTLKTLDGIVYAAGCGLLLPAISTSDDRL